ncbi:uncharacterized protein [Porites lutea]|uniref:uncharacterized protein n=1 Tax=Porites lutea TaxID=51062 RepID=UPI003CC59CF4
MALSGVILILMPAVFMSAYAVDDRNFARAHIPYLRFDGGARAKHCWPDEAKDSNDGKCKDFNSKAPIYYDVVDCADKYRKLVWWFWYGRQNPCTGSSGAHDNDWEHITINFIKDGSGAWKQDSVTWFQHDGWYTRRNTAKSPSVYVGKNAHGSYDNWCDGRGFVWEQDYCAGGCGYWDDFRNDKKGRRWTPTNIKHVSEVTGRVANRIKDEKYFDDTRLNRCIGANSRCVKGPCGCWRNNHTFPAPKCNV